MLVFGSKNGTEVEKTITIIDVRDNATKDDDNSDGNRAVEINCKCDGRDKSHECEFIDLKGEVYYGSSDGIGTRNDFVVGPE